MNGGFEQRRLWQTFKHIGCVQVLLRANIQCLQDQKRELLLETMNAIIQGFPARWLSPCKLEM
jgi:hypothetical protein